MKNRGGSFSGTFILNLQPVGCRIIIEIIAQENEAIILI